MNIKDSPLKWIAWESTRKCNLRCIHCRSGAESAKFESIDTKNAYFLMDRVAEFANPVFVLSGGEPLLRLDIFDIAEYGTKKGFRMALATNGTMLDDKICSKIKDVGIKIVSLSIDGSKPHIHDEFRKQKGAFKEILKGIRLLNKYKIDFIVNSSFTRRNQYDIENTYKLAKKLKALAWYMFIVVPIGRGKNMLDEMIDRDDYEKILKWHCKMEMEENRMIMRPTCAPSYYRVFTEEQKKKKEHIKRKTLTFSPGGSKGCVAAQSIAYINAEGDVYPCSYFTESGGNLFKQSFIKIWNSELFRKFRDYSAYTGRCGICEYRNICGGCRARAHIYNNDMASDDPYCSYVPMQERKQCL